MVATNSLVFLFNLFSILVLSAAIDTLEPNQQIRDGEFLVSSGENFRLGFFRPGNSPNRFVGIWFNKVSVLTAVWVANRQTPLTDSSGVLTVTNRGLTVLNGNRTVIWSSGSNSTESSGNLVAQLLDSGNLITRERNETDIYTWQSFDHPTDTLIAGMKLGRNNWTGVDRHLSSWTSSDDPTVGNYTFELDPRGFPQLVGRQDSVQKYCSGPWNGLRFSRTPNLKPNPYYNYEFVFNQEEAYYAYHLKDNDVKTRLVLSLNGDVQRFMWNDRNQEWIFYLKIQIDICDNFASCGAYGRCKVDNSPQCMCLEKFEPRYPSEWNGADWSQGCVRKKPLDCQKGDGFVRYSDLKLPDTKNSWYDKSMNLEDCKMVCLRNCSCSAYTRLDIITRSGCLLWFGDLIDLREYPQNGQEIYVRLASSEVGSSKKKRVKYTLSFVLVIGMLILGVSVLLFVRKKKKEEKKKKQEREELLEQPDYGMTSASDHHHHHQQQPWSSNKLVPRFLRGSPPRQPPSQPQSQLHFSNNAPYWNAASASNMNDVRSGFFPSLQMQLPNSSNFDEKPKNTVEVLDTGVGKKNNSESSSKRSRSTMPPFKVRKEKMGDRVTALQQLVSPFGKTDTASVLSEAIEYIKFLHEQVLSSPYMKSGAPPQVHHQQVPEKSKDPEGPKQDLRSRGLCLVPVSSTYPVTHETTVDFWTPTFGGTFR